jgi:hypothetical protein
MKLSPPAWLFLGGALPMPLAFFNTAHPSWFVGPGLLMWVIAYFWVMVDNTIKKSPIQTRGGVVHYKSEPIAWCFAIGILYLFGFGLSVMALAFIFA